MPIEIKELHIKVVVQDDESAAAIDLDDATIANWQAGSMPGAFDGRMLTARDLTDEQAATDATAWLKPYDLGL